MKSSIFQKSILGALILSSSCAIAASPADLIPPPEEMEWAIDKPPYHLGDAYATKKKQFLEAACVEGDVRPDYGGLSDLKTAIRTDYQDVVNTLGMGANARFRTSVIDTSASAEMSKTAHDNGYSVTLLFKFDSHYFESFDTSKDKVINIKKSFAYLLADPKGAEAPFQRSCGDEFVVRTNRVANLLVTVRVNFSSKEKAEEFHAKASLAIDSGALSAGAGAKFDSLSKSLDQHSSVDVMILQVGGLPGLSGQALCPLSTDGKPDLSKCGEKMLSCSMSNFKDCGDFLQQAIAYAGGSFSTQVTDVGANGKRMPVNYAINGLKTATYKSAGEFPAPVDEVENAMLNTTLTNLNIEFENFFPAWLRANEANKRAHPRLSETQTKVISQADTEGWRYLMAIQKAVRACYDRGFQECTDLSKEAAKVRQEYFDSVNSALASVNDKTNAVKDHKSLGTVIDAYTTPESYAQFCDIADDKHLAVDYAVRTIDAWLKEHDQTEYEAEGKKLDKCGEQQNYLSRLTELNVNAAGISTQALEMDMRVFASLKNLQQLSITNAKVRSAAPLARLTGLTALDLGNNNLSDACDLRTLPKLSKLVLENNQINDVSCLNGMSALTDIDIRGNTRKEVVCPSSVMNCKNKNLASLMNQSPWAREFQGPVVGMSVETLASGLALVSGGSQVVFSASPIGSYTPEGSNEKRNIFSYTTTWQSLSQIQECDSIACIPVGTLKDPRQFATSTRLSSGEVVIAGGATASLEVYNPGAKQTTLVADRFMNPRSFHTATLLPHDRVLYVGGYETAPHEFRTRPASSTIEVFNGATKKIEARCPLRIGRAEHTATDLGNGKILIVGGFRADKMVDQMELITVRQNDTTSECSSQIIGQRMHEPRAGHAAVRNGNKLYIVGGFTWSKDSSPKVVGVASVEVIDLKDFSVATSNERLSYPRGGLVAVTVADGRTLLVGGTNSDVLGYPYKPCVSEINETRTVDKNHCELQPQWSGAPVVGADDKASDKVDIFDSETSAIYGGATMDHAREGAAIVPIGLQRNTVLVLGGAGKDPILHGTGEVLLYK